MMPRTFSLASEILEEEEVSKPVVSVSTGRLACEKSTSSFANLRTDSCEQWFWAFGICKEPDAVGGGLGKRGRKHREESTGAKKPTWVVVALTPTNAVRRATHSLTRSEQGVDALAAIGLLDLDGIVFVVGSQAEAVRDEGAEHGTVDPAIGRGGDHGFQHSSENNFGIIVRLARGSKT